jgi:hypothetical protein
MMAFRPPSPFACVFGASVRSPAPYINQVFDFTPMLSDGEVSLLERLRLATISAYLSGDGVKAWSLPLAILVLVAVSYFTRPPNRRLVANAFGAPIP